MDLVPTFTTSNQRICLLLANGKMGFLRIEDAERLQVSCILTAQVAFVCFERQGSCCILSPCNAAAA